MQDDPLEDVEAIFHDFIDEVEYKWLKIRNDISIACGKGGIVLSDDDWDETDENSVDLSEFDLYPNHSQAAQIFFPDDPSDDDNMFSDSNPEQDSLRENLLVADISRLTAYDYFDEAPCKSYIRKLLGDCLVYFVIISLLILIPMILYGYVWWFSRKH